MGDKSTHEYAKATTSLGDQLKNALGEKVIKKTLEKIPEIEGRQQDRSIFRNKRAQRAELPGHPSPASENDDEISNQEEITPPSNEQSEIDTSKQYTETEIEKNQETGAHRDVIEFLASHSDGKYYPRNEQGAQIVVEDMKKTDDYKQLDNEELYVEAALKELKKEETYIESLKQEPMPYIEDRYDDSNKDIPQVA